MFFKSSKKNKSDQTFSSFQFLIFVLCFIYILLIIFLIPVSIKFAFALEDVQSIPNTADLYTDTSNNLGLNLVTYDYLFTLENYDFEFSTSAGTFSSFPDIECNGKTYLYYSGYNISGNREFGGSSGTIYNCVDNLIDETYAINNLVNNIVINTGRDILLLKFGNGLDSSPREFYYMIVYYDDTEDQIYFLNHNLTQYEPEPETATYPEIRFVDGKGGRYASTTTQWDYELFIPESYDGWAGIPYAYNSTTTIYSGLSFRFMNLDSDTWVNATTTTYKRETIVWTDPFRFFDPVYEPTYGEWDGNYTFSIYDDGVYKIDPPYEYYSPEQLAEGVYAVEMCFVVNLDANISCETIYNESEFDFQNRICSSIDEGYSFNSCGWYPYNDFSLGCEPSTSIQYPVDHVTCSYDFIMIGTSTTYDEDDFNDLTANPEYYMSSSQFDNLSTKSESLDFCQNPDNVVTRALCGLFNLGFTRLEKMLSPSPTVMDQLFTDIWSNLKTSVPLGYVTRLVYIFTTDDIATSTVPTLAFTFTKSFPDDLVGKEIEFDVFGTSSFAFLNQVKSDSSAETPFWDIFMDYFNLFLAISLFAVIIKDILGIDLGKDSDDSSASVQVISQGKRHRVKKSEINWSNVKVKN